MQAAAVVARNYLPHARVLAETFRRHHPGGRLTLLVVDGAAEVEGADVVGPAAVGVDERELRRRAVLFDAQGVISSLRAPLLAAPPRRAGGAARRRHDRARAARRPVGARGGRADRALAARPRSDARRARRLARGGAPARGDVQRRLPRRRAGRRAVPRVAHGARPARLRARARARPALHADVAQPRAGAVPASRAARPRRQRPVPRPPRPRRRLDGRRPAHRR